MGRSRKKKGVWDSPWGRYVLESRDLVTSLVLVLPLFAIYQVGVLFSGGVRNGVDFMTDLVWWTAGANLTHYLLLNLAVIGVLGGVAYGLRGRSAFQLRVWPWVLLESTIYAFFFGGLVWQIMLVLDPSVALSVGAGELSPFSAVILSIGAGLYEELVFRLFLLGGLFWLATRALGWPAWLAATVALVLSSLAFSAVHHLGPLGDPFTPEVFIFRLIAGALLALIFVVRGFAVAVYTHAIYDVIVLVF